MSKKQKRTEEKEQERGLTTFKLGLKEQPESEPKGSQDGPDESEPSKDQEPEPTSDVAMKTALARLAMLARGTSDEEEKGKLSSAKIADPSPQEMIDDPDYASTFNVLNGLKGRSAKGDFAGLEIKSSGIDLSSVSDRIFETAWAHAKSAIKSPSKSTRVKKILAALDGGNIPKSVVPSVSIIPNEPACNFVYQSASAPCIDAYTSEISTLTTNK